MTWLIPTIQWEATGFQIHCQIQAGGSHCPGLSPAFSRFDMDWNFGHFGQSDHASREPQLNFTWNMTMVPHAASM